MATAAAKMRAGEATWKEASLFDFSEFSVSARSRSKSIEAGSCRRWRRTRSPISFEWPGS